MRAGYGNFLADGSIGTSSGHKGGTLSVGPTRATDVLGAGRRRAGYCGIGLANVPIEGGNFCVAGTLILPMLICTCICPCACFF